MDRLQTAFNPKIAGAAADMLWQFQLRKENKALLEQVQEQERRRQVAAAEANKKFKESADKMSALESRISELERERARDIQARKEFMKGDAAFKAELKHFLEGRFSEDDISAIMRGSSATGPTAALSSRPSPPSSKPSSGLAAPQNSKDLPATILPSTEVREKTNANHKIDSNGQRTVRSRHKPTIARRPVTRSRNRSTEGLIETPLEPPLAGSEASRIPRLVQGKDDIKTYYNAANEIFKRLNITQVEMEFAFVSGFISGMTDSKMGNRVINELQQLHPSRNRKDGRIEVLCDWDDVPEGLRKAGLFSPAKEPTRRKHALLGDLPDHMF